MNPQQSSTILAASDVRVHTLFDSSVQSGLVDQEGGIQSSYVLRFIEVVANHSPVPVIASWNALVARNSMVPTLVSVMPIACAISR